MNQEKIMKRKMISAIILWLVTLVALLVFIGLYIDQKNAVQRQYKEQFRTELSHASKEIDSYLTNGGDLELRYKRIYSAVSCANSYAFLVDDFADEQRAINGINTCLIKYPEQMGARMEELKTAIDDIIADLDRGYEEADALVVSVDKKGN